MEDLKNLAKKFGTPLYVYNESKIKENYQKIKDSFSYKNSKILFALMCINNLKIIRTIKNLGVGVQLNSENEINLAKKAGFDSSKMSFTSVGLDEKLIKKFIDGGIKLNLDSIEEVKKFCNLTKSNSFGIRVAIPKKIKLASHQATNISSESNVGIRPQDFEKIKEIAKKTNNKVKGIHGYLASNVLESKPFIEFGSFLVNCASEFPDLEYVNFGGGFGVKSTKEEKEFDFEKVLGHYSNLVENLSRKLKRDVELEIEPGRSILANAGILLTQVTNTKKINNERSEIAIDAGFGEFARPRIYGAYHEIKNLEDSNKSIKLYDIRANTVLQNDFLGKDRKLKEVKEGDFLIIKNTGAYGVVMASGFPGKELPKEIIIKDTK